MIPSLISKFQSKFRANRFILFVLNHVTADPSGREVYGLGLRPLACWDCGSESRRRNRCLSLVSPMWCQEEVSATGRSLVQSSHTDCCVIAKSRKGRLRPGIGSKRHRKIKPYTLYKSSGVTQWLIESRTNFQFTWFPLLPAVSGYGVAVEIVRLSCLNNTSRL
jgi:hypothetical protein